MANGLKKRCYGQCTEGDWCNAEDIVHVEVSGNGIIAPWQFYYCKEAIKRDEKSGFIVNLIGEWTKAEQQ